ncbi:hypothetical protein Droror1_Dr00017045 [Drosera rotundifolia]
MGRKFFLFFEPRRCPQHDSPWMPPKPTQANNIEHQKTTTKSCALLERDHHTPAEKNALETPNDDQLRGRTPTESVASPSRDATLPGLENDAIQQRLQCQLCRPRVSRV